MKRYSIFVAPTLFIVVCCIVFTRCKKDNNQPIYLGTVIGFDQCNGRPSDSSAQGYVIKIEKVIGSDTLVVDTAMCYNLLKVFTFHPQLFSAYKFTYLFPPEYQNVYKFNFSYEVTPKQNLFFSLCTADINLGPVYSATKNEQITITKFYGTIP